MLQSRNVTNYNYDKKGTFALDRGWKIEEYFRFKKQQFGFEKELVRTLNSIRTLNVQKIKKIVIHILYEN